MGTEKYTEIGKKKETILEIGKKKKRLFFHPCSLFAFSSQYISRSTST